MGADSLILHLLNKINLKNPFLNDNARHSIGIKSPATVRTCACALLLRALALHICVGTIVFCFYLHFHHNIANSCLLKFVYKPFVGCTNRRTIYGGHVLQGRCNGLIIMLISRVV